MNDFEKLFVRYFPSGDKRKEMKYMKPNQKEESHATTFFVGNNSFLRFAFFMSSR